MSLKKLISELDMKDPVVFKHIWDKNIPVALEAKNIKKLTQEIRLITPVLENIFDKFSRPEYHGEEIRVYKPDGSVDFYLSQDRYLYYMYQTLGKLSSHDPDIPSFTEIMYLLIYNQIGDKNFYDKICTGEISIFTNYIWVDSKDELDENDELKELEYPHDRQELEQYENKLSQGRYKLYTEVDLYLRSLDTIIGLNSEEFVSWVDTYLSRIEQGCRFNSLILSSVAGTKMLSSTDISEGHQSIIFSYMTEKKHIYFAHYNSMGNISELSSLHTGVENLIEDITKVAENKDYTAEYIPDILTSCYIGPQKSGEKYDQKGFCVMYSLFWLYCVINIMAKVDLTGDINFPNLLASVDRFLIMNQKQLHTVLINFTKFLSNGYIESQDENNRKFLLGKIPELILELLNKDKKRGFLPRKPSEPISSEFIQRKNDDIWHKNIEKRALRKTTRKLPGSSCEEDRECFSDQCIDNICSDFGN